jgi:hypothetical protein
MKLLYNNSDSSILIIYIQTHNRLATVNGQHTLIPLGTLLPSRNHSINNIRNAGRLPVQGYKSNNYSLLDFSLPEKYTAYRTADT